MKHYIIVDFQRVLGALCLDYRWSESGYIFGWSEAVLDAFNSAAEEEL